jgi:hypothetical protein
MAKKLPTLEELEGKYEPEELKDLTDEEILEIFKGVETVWDYEPTEGESDRVGGLQYYELDDNLEISVDRPMTKIEYFREYDYSPDLFLQHIRLLLLLRGEKEKAKEYFNLLSKETQEWIAEREATQTCGFEMNLTA